MDDMVERIREELSQKELKQKDLVEYLGESQAAVAKWLSRNENIRNNIPSTILFKIAEFLDVDAKYLAGLQDDKK